MKHMTLTCLVAAGGKTGLDELSPVTRTRGVMWHTRDFRVLLYCNHSAIFSSLRAFPESRNPDPVFQRIVVNSNGLTGRDICANRLRDTVTIHNFRMVVAATSTNTLSLYVLDLLS